MIPKGLTYNEKTGKYDLIRDSELMCSYTPEELNAEKKLNKKVKEANKVDLKSRPFYDLKSILGNTWATFYILLGGAQAGKSYSVMDFCLNQKKRLKEKCKFYWFRLTDSQSAKLLSNNAQDFVDPDLIRKYNLTLKTNGSVVYTTKYVDKKVKHRDGSEEIISSEVKSKRKELARILDLSTFYKDKGVGYFDKDFDGWYNICIDEFQPEKGERRTFDIMHAFIRALENIVRNTKTKVRVFMMANLLEEASDILASFNFFPENFGRYKLVKNKKQLINFIREYNEAQETHNDKMMQNVESKYSDVDFGPRAVIDYIEPTDAYKKMRHGSIADRMMKDNSEYSNEITVDKTLVFKGKLLKPTNIIKFSKDKKDWFTVWDGKIIKRYNGENVSVIAMKPYIDEIFQSSLRDQMIMIFDNRAFLYRDLITFKLFQNAISLIKPRGK